MIENESHTKEWLEKTKGLLKGKDPILIEKVIKALTLLEQLKLKGLHPGFTKFNKFKKYRPEAFFYWYQAVELLGEKK
jgi:uncharacterized Fe-S cluster-containing radical SAM superfamily protein